MKQTIPKSWALSISNIGVAAAVIAALLLTNNFWVLSGLVLIPLNLFVWRHTSPGVMVIECGDEREVEVVLDIKEKECGDIHSCRGAFVSGGGRHTSSAGNTPVTS